MGIAAPPSPTYIHMYVHNEILDSMVVILCWPVRGDQVLDPLHSR